MGLDVLHALIFALGYFPASPAFADDLRFDAKDVNAGISACSDFYEYACGNWIRTHPIPKDRSAWDPYYQLAEKTGAEVRAILEGGVEGKGPEFQKVTTYYAACMDNVAIEKSGLSPLRDEFTRISAPDPVTTLAGVQSLGTDALFAFYPAPDFDNAQQEIANLDVASLGMTDRDYYLKDDDEAKRLRAQYRDHVELILQLSGLPEAAARAGADAIVRLETAMARARPSREERRNPDNRHHELTRAQLDALTPGWPWNRYFSALGVPDVARVNVSFPNDLSTAISTWLSLEPSERRAYLRWSVVNELAWVLPANIAEADFAFYGRTLRGTQEMEPRWKACGRLTNSALGEAVGKLYAERHFSSEQKARALEEIRAIQTALRDDILALPWMSAATRKEALSKLERFRIKVGYPDRWRTYDELEVRAKDAAGNAVRARRFEFARQLAKIGKPVDREEWESLPQEIDGYHSASGVEVVFTAGILQPPFFDGALDNAVNFGAIGRAIGHELTHGFDDHGRKFDSLGNLRDWWTKDDAARFEESAECLADEYAQFTVVDDKKLNGRLTLGENIADNGGVRLAFAALEKTLEGKTRATIDGFTPEQRFFLAFARTQCNNTTDETLRNRLLRDPHSPGKWRVNGSLRNFAPFATAFGCKPGEAMVSPKPCRVW